MAGTYTWHNGLSKQAVAQNSVLFNIILEGDLSSLTKSIATLGKKTTSLRRGDDQSLITRYNESRESIVNKITQSIMKDFNQLQLTEIVKNGCTGISEWSDEQLIEFCIENFSDISKQKSVIA